MIRGRLACWGWKEEGGEKRGEKEAPPPPPSPPTYTVVYRMTSAAKRAEAEMCAWKVRGKDSPVVGGWILAKDA